MWHVPIVAKTRPVAWLFAFASGLVFTWNSTVSRADCIGYANDPPYPLVGTVEIADRMIGELAVVSSYAYLTAFLPVTHPNGQLYIVDTSDAANPYVVGSASMSGYPGSVASDGSHAYVITEAESNSLIRVFDVDPPNAPLEIAAVPTTGRDLALVGDLLYVASSHLEIMDVSNPTMPVTIGDLFTPLSNPKIAVSGAHVYMTGTQSPGRLLIVDVSDPTTPTLAGEYNHDFGSGSRTLAKHGDIVVVRSSPELLAIDVSDPSTPTVVGLFTAPEAGDLAFDASGNLYSYGDQLEVYDFAEPNQLTLIGSTTPPDPFGRLAVADSHVYLFEVNWVTYRMHLDLLPVQCPVTQGVQAVPAAIVALETPRPNPFRGQTAIHYELAAANHVNLRILDVQGRLVRRLEDEAWKLPGSHHAVWNGRDDRGREVAPGVYYAWIRLIRPDGSRYSGSRGLTLLE